MTRKNHQLLPDGAVEVDTSVGTDFVPTTDLDRGLLRFSLVMKPTTQSGWWHTHRKYLKNQELSRIALA